MQLFKKIPFDHNEKNYEICIFYEDNLINFSTFQNNYPANGFRYQVQLPKYVNIEKILSEENLADFIDMARTDIVKNRWQNFTKLFS